jgi:hypothetical protein
MPHPALRSRTSMRPPLGPPCHRSRPALRRGTIASSSRANAPYSTWSRLSRPCPAGSVTGSPLRRRAVMAPSLPASRAAKRPSAPVRFRGSAHRSWADPGLPSTNPRWSEGTAASPMPSVGGRGSREGSRWTGCGPRGRRIRRSAPRAGRLVEMAWERRSSPWRMRWSPRCQSVVSRPSSHHRTWW